VEKPVEIGMPVQMVTRKIRSDGDGSAACWLRYKFRPGACPVRDEFRNSLPKKRLPEFWGALLILYFCLIKGFDADGSRILIENPS